MIARLGRDAELTILATGSPASLQRNLRISRTPKKIKPIYELLSGKYKVLSQQRPFVGDQFARFESPGGIIELDAPHMSFEMDVRYLRSDLVQKFKDQSEVERQAKKKSEASKF